MTNRQEIRTIVTEELKHYLTEAMGRKDFVMMVQLIRGFPSQYRKVLMDFAVAVGKSQNPSFDEDRFRDAVMTDKPV